MGGEAELRTLNPDGSELTAQVGRWRLSGAFQFLALGRGADEPRPYENLRNGWI